MKHVFNHARNRYLFLLDMISCVCAYVIATRIILPAYDFMSVFSHSFLAIAMTAIVYTLVLTVVGIYSTNWVHASASDYMRLLAGMLSSGIFSMILGAIIFRSNHSVFPKLNLAANATLIVMICALRFSLRMIYKLLRQRANHDGKRVLIVGAGNLAVALLRDINENEKLQYNVVGLIDDDPLKKNMHIYGASVIGNRNDIINICNEKNIEEIIFAIYIIDSGEKAAILDLCAQTHCKVKIFPGFEAMLEDGSETIDSLREVKIEDLLERDPVHLDNDLIENNINGKTVLVTGGGGSIGSELCRQIVKYNPGHLIILDIYENTSYELQNELEEGYPDVPISVLIGSVRDKKRLNEIFDECAPDVVFHAAAHKHVPLMEFSPGEAVKNNVFGTYNTALCAVEHNVKRFVMISTDKAVNPTNVMGATKRLCEMVVQTMQHMGKTEFVAVRFGNVLGSNGSVIPRFSKQIAAGGPVTVTHPEITRFFMTIPEAAQLVLQAATYAKGGEIFVLDMGEPVKIYDLAKKMISLSGFKPDVDIEIKFTGLRPGEKLYEELLMNEEGLEKTAHSKIYVGQPIDISLSELNNKLDILNDALKKDNDEIKKAIEKIVPTYHRIEQ